MTRVLHTADTHIGYRQYHSPERREDFLRAFERVVDDAVAADVDAVVHAGDLFHDRRPELPDLLGTLSALETLADAGIPFLAIVGNHESARGGQWLDLFERLGLATRLGRDPTVVGDVAFYGLDHVPASLREDLDYEFTPADADHVALVAHGLFEPFAHADWDTGALLRAATVDVDALLLGDNHAPGRAQVDGTWVTYPGSTERTSASERDARGYNLVAFGADADADDGVGIRRRSLETRPFAFVEIDLADGEGIERVRERLREHDLSDAVAVVEIIGDGEPVTPAAVEEFAAERGALIARVADRREVDPDAEREVSFADPDDAVRERVDAMGLSAAALDVEGTVRGDVPDSRVRETVKRRVRERLDDGDLDGFRPADEGDAGADDSADDPGNGTDADAGTEAAESEDDPESESGSDPGPDAEPEAGDGQASVEEFL